MSAVEKSVEGLARAAGAWVDEGDGGKLARWLGREVDGDGVPIRLAVAEWARCLEILAAARRGRGEWPAESAEAIGRLVLAALRFSRPGGGPVLHEGCSNGEATAWGSPDWKHWYRGTGIGRVLGWWSGDSSRRGESIPPPLPTWMATDRVLGMLRPDWRADGDFLAVDHRDGGAPCRFELFGSGRAWLGPEWGDGGGPASRPRLARAISGASADLIEWSHRAGGARITRSALLLRGRRLAMVSALVEGRGTGGGVEPALRLSMPTDVAAGAIKDLRILSLGAPGRRGGVQVVPIALPCRPYETERGSLRAEGRDLILSQPLDGRRCWLPLLVSWHAARHRKALSWRVLTVSERSRPVPAGRAFAARVSWGREETYVIYRSLGPPARRAFLGHQTAARFLIADFDQDGDLTPILTVE